MNQAELENFEAYQKTLKLFDLAVGDMESL